MFAVSRTADGNNWYFFFYSHFFHSAEKNINTNEWCAIAVLHLARFSTLKYFYSIFECKLTDTIGGSLHHRRRLVDSKLSVNSSCVTRWQKKTTMAKGILSLVWRESASSFNFNSEIFFRICIPTTSPQVSDWACHFRRLQIEICTRLCSNNWVHFFQLVFIYYVFFPAEWSQKNKTEFWSFDAAHRWMEMKKSWKQKPQ